MKIELTIWRDQFVDKIRSKHDVSPDEVEEVLGSGAHFRKEERGHVQGEDLYSAYGRTFAGRYLVVFFVLKESNAAMPISARDMTSPERRYYGKAKER